MARRGGAGFYLPEAEWWYKPGQAAGAGVSGAASGMLGRFLDADRNNRARAAEGRAADREVRDTELYERGRKDYLAGKAAEEAQRRIETELLRKYEQDYGFDPTSTEGLTAGMISDSTGKLKQLGDKRREREEQARAKAQEAERLNAAASVFSGRGVAHAGSADVISPGSPDGAVRDPGADRTEAFGRYIASGGDPRDVASFDKFFSDKKDAAGQDSAYRDLAQRYFKVDVPEGVDPKVYYEAMTDRYSQETARRTADSRGAKGSGSTDQGPQVKMIDAIKQSRLILMESEPYLDLINSDDPEDQLKAKHMFDQKVFDLMNVTDPRLRTAYQLALDAKRSMDAEKARAELGASGQHPLSVAGVSLNAPAALAIGAGQVIDQATPQAAPFDAEPREAQAPMGTSTPEAAFLTAWAATTPQTDMGLRGQFMQFIAENNLQVDPSAISDHWPRNPAELEMFKLRALQAAGR